MSNNIITSVCCLISFLICIAPAESRPYRWVNVGETEQTIFYMDTQNIKRKGNEIQFYVLTDYKKPRDIGGKNYKSAIHLRTIDCKLSIDNIKYMIMYRGDMGHGESLRSGNITDQPAIIVPGSIDDHIKTQFCTNSLILIKKPEWKKIGIGQHGDRYIDINNVQRKNGIVYYWSVEDYINPIRMDDEDVKSAKIYMYINCKKSEVTTKYIYFYSDQMGEGKSVDGEDFNFTKIITQGGYDDNVKKLYCSKKD